MTDDRRGRTSAPRRDEENLGVYGVEKIWRQLHREGVRVGRERSGSGTSECQSRAPLARPKEPAVVPLADEYRVAQAALAAG